MLSEASGTCLLAGAQAVETFTALHPPAGFVCSEGGRKVKARLVNEVT